MKYSHIIFLIVFIPAHSSGQNEYFATDSSKSIGINLIDGGDLTNSRMCQVKNGAQTTKYSPYELKEFGFKDGRVYISKEIQIADSSIRVFLKRLHKRDF
ncbi:MAG: hypothetical protein HN704_07245 [Bacteroidetes bacterium]|nr:hypothetical protein [Bacteroidota bacterium]MBT6685391.1 hypothetical protein [Bacteroidota bacterium]MBT7141803.1 hypothetical protein [Bacteroidota bacterium]MBT7491383.1 hypothetical protein [Bacteroidota bacterium]